METVCRSQQSIDSESEGASVENLIYNYAMMHVNVITFKTE